MYKIDQMYVMNLFLAGFFFRTFIGDPIPYDPDVTPEQLAVKVNYLLKPSKITFSLLH